MQATTGGQQMRGILWGICIMLVILLGWSVFQFKAPTIQEDILNRTTQAVREVDPNAKTTVDGRFVTLQGTSPSLEAKKKTVAAAANVWGALGPDDKLQVVEKMQNPVEQPSSSQPATAQPSPAQATGNAVSAGQIGSVQENDTQLTQQKGGQLSQEGPAPSDVTTSDGAKNKPSNTPDDSKQPYVATATPSTSVPTAEETCKACAQSILRVMKGNTILFNTDSSRISPMNIKLIEKISNAARPCVSTGLHVSISGYTDSTGSNAWNQTLSQHRAEAVKVALILRGLPSEWISTQGFGETRPVRSNKTAEGRAQNRRATIDLTIH
jgi:outer membrane protein OmpA-like peptidoglycan-associated protein